jgi:putative ATP-binding cassette transporter
MSSARQASELVKLVQEYSGLSLGRIIYVAGLAGLCSTALIALVNYSAARVAAQDAPVWAFALFIPLLISYTVLVRINNKESMTATQILIHRIRMRVMGEVLKTDLLTLQKIGPPHIMTILSRDTLTISQGATMFVPTCQAMSMLVFAVGYLFYLSFPAGLITLVFGCAIIVYFAGNFTAMHDKLEDAWMEEGQANSQISDFLTGFKEIKMNSARAFDISSDIINSSRHVADVKARTFIYLSNGFASIQVMIYAFVGVAIFVIPVISSEFYKSVVAVSTTVLFIAGSLTGIISSLPLLSQANTAAEEVNRFMAQLEAIKKEIPAADDFVDQVVERISVENVSYRFESKPGATPFVLGPISCDFEAGKVYFVRGGNGSGKTSFIHILTGLIAPDSGRILLNGVEVNSAQSQAYRDLFSTIFSDFHLFKKLYGMYDTPDEEVDKWLKKLELPERVTFQSRAFSDLNVSTGQKKRIALIVSILEKRPIIILDEWASDQDPEFRKFFYEKIIPELRAMNKIVIAITHDDHYFHEADHLLFIQNGKLRAFD